MGICGHIDTVTCPNCSPVRHSGGIVGVSTKPYADLTLKATKPGVWVASYGDRSGYALFATEIDALRHAVDKGMRVEFVEFGSEF